MSVRVYFVLLSFVRYIMTGMMRWASREEVLMMAAFLAAADVAFNWLPAGSPLEVVDVVVAEYLGYAREVFLSSWAFAWASMLRLGLVCFCAGLKGSCCFVVRQRRGGVCSLSRGRP
jgi:hypothetical protein